MTLVFMDSFQDATLMVKPEWSAAFQDVGGGRDGKTAGASGLHSNANRTLTLPSACPTICVGFAYYLPTIGWSDIPIQFNNAGGTNQASIRINGSGFIEVYRGATKIGTSSGHTPIATSTWRYIEVKITLTTATTSTVTVRLDGVTVLTITGVATAASTGDVTSLLVQGMGFGSTPSYWDDMYVCNTSGSVANDLLGDIRVQVLEPNAAGDSSQFTPSTGASNYPCVDEYPANTTDYVSDSTPGHADMYNVADLSGTVAAVYGVRVGYYNQKADVGSVSLKPKIKENSVTTTESGQSPVYNSWTGIFSSLRTVRPSDSAAWSTSDINSLQVGMEVG